MDRTNYQPSERLQELLTAAIDGVLSEEDHREFEALLSADPAARAFCVEFFQLHAHMQWHAMGILRDDAEAEQPEYPETCAAEAECHPTHSLRRNGRQQLWLAFTGLAAMVLAAAYFLGVNGSDPKLSRDADVATLSEQPGGPDTADSSTRNTGYVGVVKHADSVESDGGASSYSPGQLVPEGLITLATGTLTIDLFDGARLLLVGPCEVELDAASKLVRCVSGEVGVDVLNPESKLVVQTPVGEMIHIGTQYQISVDEESGETILHVVDGEVELVSDTLASAPGSARVFGLGASVVMRPTGELNKAAEGLALSKWEGVRDYAERPVPYVTEEGFTTRLVVLPGERAISSAEIEDHHTTLYGLDIAEEYLSRALARGDYIETTGVPHIDFQDGFEKEQFASMLRDYVNLYGVDSRVPGMPPNDRPNECFMIHATATLVVEKAWEYSFIVNADDGCRLRVDGADVVIDSTIHPPQQSVGTLTLDAGEHEVELVSFDHYGFYRLELGVAPGKVRSAKHFSLLRARQPSQ